MEKDLRMENINVFRNVNTELTQEDLMMLSPLQLAYIGDAVYELMVRTYLLKKDTNVNNLHKATTRYVKAKSQSDIVHKIKDFLTAEEIQYVKKGRNTKIHSSPKNADMLDYKYATGFECMVGYLYLTNQDKRLKEIIEEIKNLEI